jgi:hypothetical protein
LLHPALQILAGHFRFVDDQRREVHGVVDGRVVQLERELVVGLDPLLDLRQVADLDPEERLLDTVIQ